MRLHDFTIQKNMNLMMHTMRIFAPLLVRALIFDEFGHRCWLHFDAHLATNSMSFRNRLIDDFGDGLFEVLVIKMVPISCQGDGPFLDMFSHLERSWMRFGMALG